MIVKYGRTSMTAVTLSNISPTSEKLPVAAKAKDLLSGYQNIQTAPPLTFERTFTCFAENKSEITALIALRGIKGYLYVDDGDGTPPSEYYGVVIMSLTRTWMVGGKWGYVIEFAQSV